MPPHDPFVMAVEGSVLVFFGARVPDPGGDWDGPWDTLSAGADRFLLDLLSAVSPGGKTVAEWERTFAL